MKNEFWKLTPEGPQRCTIEEWEKRNSDDPTRRIGHNYVSGVWVSTIFMGINTQDDEHGPPLLYQTLIWGTLRGERLGRREESYETPQQAREGHRRWVEHFRAESRGDEQPK